MLFAVQNMLAKLTRAALVIAAALSLLTAQAQTSAAVDLMAQREFSGEWYFVNAASGQHFGGDVSLRLVGESTASPLTARVSYDGRQTNDNCSTRGMFKDVPVDANVIRTDAGYDVTFSMICARGQSPRAFSWTMTCKAGVCTVLHELPHGKGGITLRPGLPAGQTAAANFRPYKLVGSWLFANTQTGARYGGDIAIDVKSAEGNGVQRGLAVFDGTQTNDKCGTRTLFSNDPVEAEVQKLGTFFRVSFNVKCGTGGSRLHSWTLICKGEVCTMPSLLPHGNGATVLREVHE